MNIQDIKKFLEENKESEEVQAFINSFKVGEEATLEVFKQKIETDPEFISFMDSEKDKHHSKALETWKSNNLDVIVDQKVNQLYPKDDPKDLELKKLQQKMEELENERIRERMTNLALKKANELQLPTELVEYFVANDENATLENINKFSEVYTNGIQTTLKEKLEGQGDKVPKNDSMGGITEDDFGTMTHTERDKLYRTNRELYDELAK